MLPSSTLRITAWLLAAQGSIALVCGAMVLALAAFGERAPLGRTGDVVGPPDEVVSFVLTSLLVALGGAAFLLGALDLVAGIVVARGGASAWMLAACPMTALAWLLLAGWAFLRAGGSGGHVAGWCAVALVALTIALLHLAALRSCFARASTRY
jgi:hypothetical protein